MLESILMVIIAMAFILYIIAVYEQSFVFMLLSVVIWLIIMGGSLGVEVPFIDTAYTDYSLSAISMLFVFSGIVFSIVYVMEWRRKYNMP